MAEEKPVMLVGLDESEESFYALQWTLDRFFVPYTSKYPFRLILLHAKPTASAAIGMAGPGAIEVISDLKRIAAKIIEKAKKLCISSISKSVNDVNIKVIEGDARNVLCEAVEKHHASILVVGSHGHGAIKRFEFRRAVLGSVGDYCAPHAHCSVLIVKRPKIKQ
ncbi:hypothetical protein Cgig2_015342 [Carnegiea gigantea]|uniref:UspA domain-containing protein n=1 Tax=Carnegiea gigantea TaxID=171969 RepID=A0A9Q1GJM4_9CARY|nr:hypothetical protein Cgig2_015342 [Carnegiea gigantea]